MKGYARSYILGTILITGAFLTLFIDFKLAPVKSKDASWVLFLGGAVLVGVGWRAHVKELNKKGK